MKDRRAIYSRKHKIWGLATTVLLHAIAAAVLIGTWVEPEYEFNPNLEILLTFPQEESYVAQSTKSNSQTAKPEPIKEEKAPEPTPPKPEIKEEAKETPQAESEAVEPKDDIVSESETLTPEEEVIVPEPTPEPKPEPKPIKREALFGTAKNKRDSLMKDEKSDGASEPKAYIKDDSGSQDGNFAELEGREVVGGLIAPKYNVEKEGRVIVKIYVDRYGVVTRANPGMQGTTVQDSELWEAAREAALNTVFNTSNSSPTIQEGRISYYFKLK